MTITFQTAHHGKCRRYLRDMWSGFSDPDRDNFGDDGFCTDCSTWVGQFKQTIAIGDAIQHTNWFYEPVTPDDVKLLLVRLHAVGLTITTKSEADEAYAIGKRDGYEDAVQAMDVATGGDGEFFTSSDGDDCPNLTAMFGRIIDRFETGRVDSVEDRRRREVSIMTAFSYDDLRAKLSSMSVEEAAAELQVSVALIEEWRGRLGIDHWRPGT